MMRLDNARYQFNSTEQTEINLKLCSRSLVFITKYMHMLFVQLHIDGQFVFTKNTYKLNANDSYHRWLIKAEFFKMKIK